MYGFLLWELNLLTFVEFLFGAGWDPQTTPSSPKKKGLSSFHFGCDESVIAAADHANFYKEGICMRYKGWATCANVGGDYVETEMCCVL